MIKDTLYFKYISEREGLDLIENNFYFATYKIVNQELFIANIFLDKDHRSSGKIAELIEKLINVAKKSSCKFMTGNIDLSDHGHSRTLKAALKLGFKIVQAQNNILLIAKEVEA